MATFNDSLASWTNATSDANFRLWGEHISDQLTAVGLIKTADTGQIDWATVSNPGAINTYAGYEIRLFADTLQATAPVYFKIEYGEGGIADNPAVRITFGTGSNGTGSVTGTTSTPITCPSDDAAVSTTVVGSGANNRFVINTSQSNGMLWGFERTKDATGADTVEGVVLFTSGSSVTSNGSAGANNARTVYWNPSTGTIVNTASSANIAAMFPWQTTFIFGAQTGVAPVFPEKPIFGNPLLGLVGCFTEDLTPGSTYSIYMYGTAHIYYVCVANSSISNAGWRGPGGGTETAAIRYE